MEPEAASTDAGNCVICGKNVSDPDRFFGDRVLFLPVLLFVVRSSALAKPEDIANHRKICLAVWYAYDDQSHFSVFWKNEFQNWN